jgi:hypothetical protein
MSSDEKGYIQFRCDWRQVDSVSYGRLPELLVWRSVLWQENLVGVDANGVGFGNVSERVSGTDSFVITATQTGDLQDLDASHFALVEEFDVHANRIRCSGAIRASSESLSHAILYELDDAVGAVVHVHDASAWSTLRDVIPTTGAAAEAGTVAMADEIGRLYRSGALRDRKVLVMGGHRDGLLSFGRDIEEAATVMLEACGRPSVSSHDVLRKRTTWSGA